MSQEVGEPLRVICAILDLSEKRVIQLTNEGVIPRIRHGRYDLHGAIRGYVRYLRERAIQGDAAGADDLTASRAELLRSRARIARLEADQAATKLLRRDEVEATWAAVVPAIRSRLLAMPTEAARAVVHLQTPAQVAALLTQAVNECLNDIANLPVYADPCDDGDKL